MKKIISKILIIFIIMITLFEFSFSSNISYAFDSEDINSITNLIGGLVAFVLWIPRLLTVGTTWLMGTLLTVSLAESCGISNAIIFAGTDGDCATPFDIFFNKYTFFDVNFFDTTNGLSMITIVRLRVAQWFYILRTISATVLLVILIYVGIRMTISTIAEDKAKYKKMFWDWCCSLALIFVLQYIAIFVIETNNVIVNFLRDYGYQDIKEGINDIMMQGMGPMGIGSLVSTVVYCMIIFQTISFMLVYIKRMIKVGFLILISPMISITYSIDKMGDGKAQALNKWLKEFVYTILIQPFHCIMYIAFVNPAMELLGTDQVTYSAGVGSVVSSLADGKFNQLANGFLAILCLKFINDGEKAIRKIFNFQDDGNMTSLAAGAAIGMAAINNAKKIGKTTAQGVTKAKNLSTKFGKAISKDSKAGGAFDKVKKGLNQAKESFKSTGVAKAMNKIGETGAGKFAKAAFAKGKFVGGKITNAGKFVGGKAKKYKDKADKIRDKIKDKTGKIKDKAGKIKNKANDFADKHKGLMKGIKGAKTLGSNAIRKSMPIALGMMGMAMSYSTGSSGAMEAIGVGSGLKSGSEEFLASSQETIEGNVQGDVNSAVENNEEVKDLQEKLDDNMDAIDETNENLSETNSKIEEMTEAEQANGNDYLAMLREEDALKARQEELKAQEELSQKELDELAEIEKRQAEIAASKQKLNDDPEIARVLPIFAHKHAMEKQLAEQRAQRNELKEQMKHKKRTVARELIEGYRGNGAASQIAKAKAEITKAIQKCMMEQKYKERQGDVNAEYTLSDKEIRSAERMQESIAALVDRAIVGGGGSLDAGQIYKRFFGQDSDSPMAESLKQAIDAYQYQARAKNYNDNENLYIGTGGEEEKFENDIIRKASKNG